MKFKVISSILVAAALLSLGSKIASGGGLTPPPGVSVPFISPTESYVFWINPSPTLFNGVFNTDYYPPTKILQDVASIDRTGPWSIGSPQGYDHGYELLGFLEPDFDGGLRSIFYWNCGDDCNGGIAQADQVVMPTQLWRGLSESCTRNTLGHELMHKIQRAYSVSTAPNSLGKWVTEGHARALQDKIYAEFDTLPETDCRTIFVSQVNNYLTDVHDQSLWNLSYDAALWWAYLMEQYGQIRDEPWYGADFLVTWYDQALAAGENASSFGITNNTIKFYDPSQSITSTYRSFVLANILKDMRLSSLSDAFRGKYSYVDEQAPGEDRYAEVTYADNLAISNADPADTSVFGVNDFAVQYFKIDVSACAGGRPIRIGFEPSPIDPFFGNAINQTGGWGVIVGQSNDGSQTLASQRPAKLYKKLDEQWSVEFFQPFSNAYETVYATTSGIGGPIIGTLRAECLPVPPNPYAPDLPLVNPLDPVTPGMPLGLTYGEVCAQPTAPLPGLDPDDYTVEVNSAPARVLAATPNDEGHCLLVEFPQQPATGVFDLTVGLAGQQITIPGGVAHNLPNPQLMIAIDASSTMAEPMASPKLADVQQLVASFIRQRVESAPAGLPNIGLIDFAGDNIEPNFDARLLAPLLPADQDHINRLNSGLNSISNNVGGFTALGDALSIAMNSFTEFGDSDQARHLVLIVDGPENDGSLWDDVRDQVIASGINVHTIALGPLADQPLLFDIARATGGSYRYVDVDENGSDLLALSEALSDIAVALAGAVSIDQQRIALRPDAAADFSINVPPQAIALLLPAVQAAREAAVSRADLLGTLTLVDPNGTEYVFDLPDNTANYIQIDAPRATTLPGGNWKASFAATSEGEDDLLLSVAARLEAPLFFSAGTSRPEGDEAVGSGFQLGDPVLLNATLVDICASRSGCQPGIPGSASVEVRHGSGSPRILGMREPDKGSPASGRTASTPAYQYAIALFLAEGSPVGANDDGMTGGVGSYKLQYRVPLAYDGYTASVLLRDGVAVADSGLRTRDSDGDGLPNPYEARKFCLEDGISDGALDLDDDGLTSLQEFVAGTDPCNPDTDGGGEKDGSELAGNRQPLQASDDAVGGIRYARVAHEVTHEDPQSFSSASITIEYASHPSVANLVLKRGIPGGSVEQLTSLSPGSGAVYVDQGLTVGTEYCYQLEPTDAAGNQGAPSHWFCATAMQDPALPWGDVMINSGRPRTDNPALTLQTSLYNKPASSSQMRIVGQGLDTGWISYAPTYVYQHPQVAETTNVSLQAQFRDQQGLESAIYQDDIELWPPQSLGKLTGRALLETLSPTAGVMLQVANASWEPPAYTDTNGRFELCDLPPGDYGVVASLLGWETANSTGWSVSAGAETDLGDVTLEVIVDPLFADSFESP